MGENMWQELLEILTKLAKDYEVLEGLAQQKHTALVGVDMKTLDKLLKREAEIAGSIRKSEKQRQELLTRISKAVPAISPDMKAADLYKLAPQQYAARLQLVHASLSEIVEKVKAQTEINNILAMGALGAVNEKLNRVGGATVDPTYGRGGAEHVSHRRNFEYDA